jgi:hypothetical protein
VTAFAADFVADFVAGFGGDLDFPDFPAMRRILENRGALSQR